MENTNLLTALKLLAIYTAGRMDIYVLSGPSNAARRSQVMSALRGVKVPASKSGVTVIREAFFAALVVDGTCLAAKDDDFREKAMRMLTLVGAAKEF